ncbi:hypothetical protein TanjilG_21317 [Lupinus angustifolius]|uniref:Actin-related protein 5 n=1 Tax=Lupinus angustifolius TaxID=3871 RepID=A0A4P1RMI0_LUPAN|nr:hypothetical protein TanjilG_21317 [Lupinus angustifolius]
MPFISKIQRQSDYNLFSSTTPISVLGETVTIVGDHDPALLKYFDRTRSRPPSAFDSNVVCQFETMEYILDFGFDRLGANGSRNDHHVLITECVCNPVQSHSKMGELLFETYGVPSIDGEPIYKGSCCINVGGYHKGAKEAEEKTRCWQLPWVPPPTDEPPSENEIARKAAIKEKQGQRLEKWLRRRGDRICPDDMLTPDQLIEKKKRLSLKSMFEGRERLKQKRHEEELERERKQHLEEEKHLYVSSVHALFYFKLFCCLFIRFFRCPEILFSPNWIAVDQLGLDEMAGVSLRRLPYMDKSLEERLTSSILVTGGSSLFPGIASKPELV